ncbi:MAG: TolC family protein [Halanaerobium sp. MSAO_Bac5]|nr:MAG: TolC family protein [Halanaerobium sp. MSAO_Bac5]
MKIKQITVFLLILLIFASITAAAAQDLSLEEAVELLVVENRQLENARKDIEKAEKDISLTTRSYFPSLELQSSYTRLDEGQSPFGELDDVEFPFDIETPNENYRTSINLTQPLWLGGKVGLQREIAGYGLEIAKADYQSQVEEEIFNLIQAYYGVLQAQGLVRIREEALEIVNEHLRVVERRLELGTAIRQDLLQSQIEARRAQEELNSAQNNLKIARRRLAQLLVSTEEYSPMRPEIDFEIILEQEELFAQAVENDLELLKLELNRKIIETRQKLERQHYRPDINLSGSYNWEGDEFLDEDSWSVTIGGSISLYDGGRAKISAEKEEKELEKLANNRQDFLENLDIEIESVILSVKENEELIELEELSLENAVENFEIANKSYEAGVASNTDVIDAQSRYNQAQISLLQAEYDYEIELFNSLYKSGQIIGYFEDVILDEK